MGSETAVVDRILGPAELRYFGSGHRNSRYALEEVQVGAGLDAQFRGTVEQLGSWSSKNGEQRTRHLSSIDALVLGSMVTESMVRRGAVPGATGHRIEGYELTDFSLHAGTQPVTVEGVPLVGRVEETGEGRLHMFIRCGNIKENLWFASPRPERAEAAAASGAPAGGVSGTFVAPGGSGGATAGAVPFMPNHLQHRIQVFHDCEITEDGKSSRMSVDLVRTDEVEYSGLGSDHSLAPSLLEYLLIWAQLSEIMAYNVDKVPRSKCGNFWMRSLEIRAVDGVLPGRRLDLDFSADLRKSRVLAVAGENFRVLNLVGSSSEGAVLARASVAHTLPEDHV